MTSRSVCKERCFSFQNAGTAVLKLLGLLFVLQPTQHGCKLCAAHEAFASDAERLQLPEANATSNASGRPAGTVLCLQRCGVIVQGSAFCWHSLQPCGTQSRSRKQAGCSRAPHTPALTEQQLRDAAAQLRMLLQCCVPGTAPPPRRNHCFHLQFFNKLLNYTSLNDTLQIQRVLIANDGSERLSFDCNEVCKQSAALIRIENTYNVKYRLMGTLRFLKRRREEEDVLLAEAVTYFNTLQTSCVKLILFSILPSGNVIVLYTSLCKVCFLRSGMSLCLKL